MLSQTALKAAAKRLGVDVATIRAVDSVESNGQGMNPDGLPKILFEGHKFSYYTGGKFDAQYPTLSYPRWTRQFYAKTQAGEYERLFAAARLDNEAAHLSTSWGRYQIMGYNFALAGFSTLSAFIDAMRESEDRHLDAFVSYCLHEGLQRELQRKDWAEFARRYNGPGYKTNQYDVKLAAAYERAADEAVFA